MYLSNRPALKRSCKENNSRHPELQHIYRKELIDRNQRPGWLRKILNIQLYSGRAQGRWNQISG